MGTLATTLDEAVAVAARIGYPVVLKIRSAQILHNTEIGGVAVGIADETALRSAWATMSRRVAAVRQGVVIDGHPVEAMAGAGGKWSSA